MDLRLFDTTLRDGTQAENINFTVSDKIRIVKILDGLGIHYIEGGWPGSNARDIDFFKKTKDLRLDCAKIVAFGSTRRAEFTCEKDPNLAALLACGATVACIFGKSWDFQVTGALNISLEENIKMIGESVAYLKKHTEEVVYDAEHFFDGFKNNRDYAMQTLKAAEEQEAKYLVLCDTNGGSMPWEVEEICDEVQKHTQTPLGIHTHNDCEVGVANALVAVRKGAKMVQGTIDGYGERCGNSNLVSLIANLKIKMGIDCVDEKQLKELTKTSRMINEIANVNSSTHRPYTGKSAFAHKGGIHVSAILKDPKTYEHIDPEIIGNKRRILVSDLSGQSNLRYKIRELGIEIDEHSPELKNILNEVKILEKAGYAYEAAEASLEILIARLSGRLANYFSFKGYRVLDERKENEQDAVSEATTIVGLPDGEILHEVSFGKGPVDALFKSLMKALTGYYEDLHTLRLVDYKVRILDSSGTASKTRVLIQSGDSERTWTTVGVDTDIIKASYKALTDSIQYKLFKFSNLS